MSVPAGRCRGIHVGEYAGIAPSRREIAVQTCEVYTLADSKVIESWVYGETMGLFNQIAERP
jgi:predicted ester cyclase